MEQVSTELRALRFDRQEHFFESGRVATLADVSHCVTVLLFSIESRDRARGLHRHDGACDAYGGGGAPRDDRNLGRDDLNHDALDGLDLQHEPRSQRQLPLASSE